jgi:Tol biopolymer transport system component
VTFDSYATNLVPGDTNNARDVFVHDRVTGETTRVSVDSAGNEGNGDSAYFSPWISADGRYVAFPSEATNLVPSDTNAATDVFVHDRVTGETTRVSVGSTGEQGDGSSWYPSMSADGRYVAFMSTATNLVTGDTNDEGDVFVHDRATGETTRVSVDWQGNQARYRSWNPSMSADGRYVTFHGGGTLTPDANPSALNVFVHDRLAGETRLVSLELNDMASIWSKGWSDYASISANGRFVAFESSDPFLVPDGNNGKEHVFVRGPELSLEADPTVVQAGQIITFTVYKSVAANPASLWVVEVSGVPAFFLLSAGSFGADDNFAVSGTVPPGLGTSDVSFRGYGLGRSGLVRRTNDVTVSFR